MMSHPHSNEVFSHYSESILKLMEEGSKALQGSEHEHLQNQLEQLVNKALTEYKTQILKKLKQINI